MKCLKVYGFFIVLLACQATSDPIVSPNPNPGTGTNQGTCNPQPPARTGIIKVLFVGNSLTYTNDLPSKFAAIAKDNGRLVEKEMIAKPNYALEDHWLEGCIQTMIRSGYYDFVVVQQGPSSLVESGELLLKYGEYIAELCKANDTKLAFYMVWPAKVNYHMFPGVITNYTNAANVTGSILCPVGSAWKAYMDGTQDFSYYGPDDFHPSELGTSVAAEIIYKALFP